jgi:hypothetical protein
MTSHPLALEEPSGGQGELVRTLFSTTAPNAERSDHVCQ